MRPKKDTAFSLASGETGRKAQVTRRIREHMTRYARSLKSSQRKHPAAPLRSGHWGLLLRIFMHKRGQTPCRLNAIWARLQKCGWVGQAPPDTPGPEWGSLTLEELNAHLVNYDDPVEIGTWMQTNRTTETQKINYKNTKRNALTLPSIEKFAHVPNVYAPGASIGPDIRTEAGLAEVRDAVRPLAEPWKLYRQPNQTLGNYGNVFGKEQMTPVFMAAYETMNMDLAGLIADATPERHEAAWARALASYPQLGLLEEIEEKLPQITPGAFLTATQDFDEAGRRQNIPCLSAAYERQFLYQMDAGQRERGCIMGQKCVGMELGRRADPTNPNAGFILKSMRAPTDSLEHRQNAANQQPAPCLLCARRLTTSWFNRNFSRNQTTKNLVQSHKNIVGCAGEYALEACLCPSSDRFYGIIAPVVMYQSHLLHVCYDDTRKLYYIEQDPSMFFRQAVPK